MLFARRASLALGGGAAVAVIAWPERPGEPSVRTVLRWLPSGLLGWVLHPTGARVPSLEVVQREACSNVAVQLCGVCHVETASADAARACVERCAASGGACVRARRVACDTAPPTRLRICSPAHLLTSPCHSPYSPCAALHAVALECDAVTFGRVRAAALALEALPPERVRAEGEARVRRAIFGLPEVHAEARRAGVELRSPSQIPLPPAIATHLRQDGALWSREVVAAAEAAEAAGARVVFLDSPPRPLSGGGGGGGGLVAWLACWLRAQALCPGRDERSCAAEQVETSY